MPTTTVPPPTRLRGVFRQLLRWPCPRLDAEYRRMALIMGLSAVVLIRDARRRDDNYRRSIATIVLAMVALAGNLAASVYVIYAALAMWTGRQDRGAVIGLAVAVVVGTLLLYIAGKLAGPGPDPMPVFTLKGKDRLTLSTIQAYQAACESAGLAEQARQVGEAFDEIAGWQSRNRGLLHYPDHTHVPVRS